MLTIAGLAERPDGSKLIEQCLADEAEGWLALWGLVDRAALHPIRAILRRHGLDLGLADDAIQELYFHLRNQDQRLLRAFAGTTEAELKGYLRALATSFARDYVRARLRAQRREAKALTARRQTRTDTDEMLATLEEFKAKLSLKQLTRLRHLWQQDGSNRSAIPARTLRRWQQSLHRQFSAWLKEHN